MFGFSRSSAKVSPSPSTSARPGASARPGVRVSPSPRPSPSMGTSAVARPSPSAKYMTSSERIKLIEIFKTETDKKLTEIKQFIINILEGSINFWNNREKEIEKHNTVIEKELKDFNLYKQSLKDRIIRGNDDINYFKLLDGIYTIQIKSLNSRMFHVKEEMNKHKTIDLPEMKKNLKLMVDENGKPTVKYFSLAKNIRDSEQKIEILNNLFSLYFEKIKEILSDRTLFKTDLPDLPDFPWDKTITDMNKIWMPNTPSTPPVLGFARSARGGNKNKHKENIKHLRKLLKNKKLTDKQREQYLKKIESIKVKIEKQNNKDKINKCKEHIKNLRKLLKNKKITEKQKQKCHNKIKNYKLKIKGLLT